MGMVELKREKEKKRLGEGELQEGIKRGKG